MTAPNMETITASLERSFQNCSLNHQSRSRQGSSSSTVGIGSSSTSDDVPENHHLISISDDTGLDINSHISLPYYWEQCLDLKTGEIYYINWRNGMKVKEDPRSTADYKGDYYSEDGESSYDSEAESSSESSPCLSRDKGGVYQYQQHHQVENEIQKNENVLVVAGCKSCLMYFMVPKQVQDCPKCTGQLLLFDRSGNGSL
ncbi:ATP-dependent RNA helicase [Quillaja saponaria]|uniref:ATP-dependent RNA helicase n=1 Tax=Quillaja saponaria TaxID=32244 RepID=A0AAD7LG01_QUISA|nr:ATP-dependent RNA helicase [Quillaja saponaria]